MSEKEVYLDVNMRIRNLKLIILLFLLAISNSLSISNSFVASAATQATTGNQVKNRATVLAAKGENILEKLGKECKNLDNWSDGDCDAYQSIMTNQLNCGDGKMFQKAEIQTDPQDSSVTKTKWFVDPNRYSECLKKAIGFATAIKDTDTPPDCSSMAHGGGVEDGGNWKECEKLQNKLFSSLGCSNKMFTDIPGDNTHDTFKPNVVDACLNSNIKSAASITLVGPDGQKATFSNDGEIAKIVDKDGNDITDQVKSASTSDSTDDTDSNCSGGPMGWLFCPMIEYMANTINAIAEIIDSLMQVRFMSSEGPVAQIEKGWRTFLSFANIMLVIAFLVIIFSQATQAGLSNYNVKRMLPRLVVAAILMNISFYICALLIDISNIVGASVMGLFVGDGSISSSIGELTNDGGFWGKAGAVIGGAALIGILVFVLPFVLLSIISVFVMLIGRQVILMCLVLVSSLAFVAWLLPNTEQYFQRWLKLFGQLLVVYPMVMLVFGASLYLSNLLGGEGGTGIVDDSMTGSDILRKLVQLIILMIPIFALPGLLKGSSSVIGRIGGVADRVGKDLRVEKVGDAVKGGATGAMKRGALNTEAAMASRGGRMGRIGNYRANRKFRQGERDEIRERIQEDAIHERYFGDDKKASDARNKLAGRLGGSAASERIKMNMDKLDLKRQLEDMEPVKLKAEAINLRIKQEQQRLSGVDMAGKLAHAESSLDAAMVSGNEESIKVWSGVAQGFGAPGRELLTNTATANVGTASAQHLADSLDYDAFQTSAPGMTEFISSAGADAPNSKGADSYGKVTVENIGKLDVSSLTTALSTYDAAGAPAISDTMVKDSLRVVNRDNLTQEHRSKLEAAATARGISFTP